MEQKVQLVNFMKHGKNEKQIIAPLNLLSELDLNKLANGSRGMTGNNNYLDCVLTGVWQSEWI